MADSKQTRTRALSPAARRSALRRYNETALSRLCEERINGEPCQGETTDDGPHPRNCKGVMAYVRNSLRQTEAGGLVALATGRCDLCGSVGHVIVKLS